MEYIRRPEPDEDIIARREPVASSAAAARSLASAAARNFAVDPLRRAERLDNEREDNEREDSERVEEGGRADRSSGEPDGADQREATSMPCFASLLQFRPTYSSSFSPGWHIMCWDIGYYYSHTA